MGERVKDAILEDDVNEIDVDEEWVANSCVIDNSNAEEEELYGRSD